MVIHPPFVSYIVNTHRQDVSWKSNLQSAATFVGYPSNFASCSLPTKRRARRLARQAAGILPGRYAERARPTTREAISSENSGSKKPQTIANRKVFLPLLLFFRIYGRILLVGNITNFLALFGRNHTFSYITYGWYSSW